MVANSILLVFAEVGLGAPAQSPFTPEERAWLDARGPLRYAPQSFTPPFEFRASSSNSAGGITPDLLNVAASDCGDKDQCTPFRTFPHRRLC